MLILFDLAEVQIWQEKLAYKYAIYKVKGVISIIMKDVTILHATMQTMNEEIKFLKSEIMKLNTQT